MTALTNPKHERFAQELAKGSSQADAYAEAGYKPSEQHASRLASHGKVQARIAEIVSRGALRAEVTIASLMQEASEIQAAAMEAKQLSAATAALTVKAKLAGLWVDKAENTNRNVDPTQVSDADLAAVVESDSRERVAAPPVNPAQLN